MIAKEIPKVSSPEIALNYMLYMAFGLIAALFFSQANLGLDSDKVAYDLYFKSIVNGWGIPEGFERIEPGFYFLTRIFSLFTQSSAVYFYGLFLIQFFLITGLFFKQSSVWPNLLVSILLWLAFPFFYGLTLNVLRQGMAFAFVLYALDRAFCGNRRGAIFFMLSAVFFHYSSLLYLFSYCLSSKIKLKTLCWCLCVCVLFSASGAALLLPQFLSYLVSFVPFVGGEYYNALMQSGDYIVGFKIRFFIVSVIPLLIVFFKNKFYSLPPNLLMVVKLYIVLLCAYFLFAGMQYNDRFAIMAWMLIPVMGCFFISKRNSHLYALALAPIAVGLGFFALFYNMQ